MGQGGAREAVTEPDDDDMVILGDDDSLEIYSGKLDDSPEL